MADSYIEHFGIKGQKWGIRRFQNEDGTLTEEGMARYGRSPKLAQKELNRADTRIAKKKYSDILDMYNGEPASRYHYWNKKADIKARIAMTSTPHYDIRRNEKLIKSIIKTANKNGYTVSSKETKRIVNAGEMATDDFLRKLEVPDLGLIPGAYYTKIQGKKYKVV